MVNKLRAFAAGGGSALVLLAAWGFVEYGTVGGALPYVVAASLGVVVAAIPSGVAHAKLWLRRLDQYRRGRRGRDAGAVFVSEEPVSDSEAALAAIADSLADEDGFEARPDSFPEGGGLTVVHSGFHNSFVRITDAGRVGVIGGTGRTARLARLVESVCDLSLARARTNPFLRPERVKGAPRVFTAVLLGVLVIAGAGVVVDAAYPSDTYNPAEKAVLVGIDARGAVDPGMSRADVGLAKAAFLVDVLKEESVEIRWAGDASDRAAFHARQALAVSETVRELLETVRSSAPTPAQSTRADRIERDLERAECSVRVAIREHAGGGTGDVGADLRAVRDGLPAGACASG